MIKVSLFSVTCLSTVLVLCAALGFKDIKYKTILNSGNEAENVTFEFGKREKGDKLVYNCSCVLENEEVNHINLTQNNTIDYKRDFVYVNFSLPSKLKNKVEAGFDPETQMLTIKQLEPNQFKTKTTILIMGFKLPFGMKSSKEKLKEINDEYLKYEMFLITV